MLLEHLVQLVAMVVMEVLEVPEPMAVPTVILFVAATVGLPMPVRQENLVVRVLVVELRFSRIHVRITL